MSVLLVNAEAGRIPLPDGSVHCSVSSPPYWGLRKYKGDQVRDWPGVQYAPMPGLPALCVPAWRGALGAEPTLEAFVGHLVLCYREVRRVLREDGVAWVVCGDSFATTPRGNKPGDLSTSSLTNPQRQDAISRGQQRIYSGVEQGNLLGIPYRLMLALQADGWVCRSDVVWAKAAPQPESVAGWSWQRHRVKIASHIPVKGGYASEAHVRPQTGLAGHSGNNRPNGARWTDCPGCPTCAPNGGYVLRRGSWRHTRSHETVLMLTRQMGYWADQEAVKEPSTGQTGSATNFQRASKDHVIPGQQHAQHRLDRESTKDDGYRNPRDVLSPSGEGGFSGEHYATYPKNLIAPLIRATCPRRRCPVCGAGYAIVVERMDIVDPAARGSRFDRGKTGVNGAGRVQKGERYLAVATSNYRPTCDCGREDWVPGIVFDPFVGSGTTLLEARAQGLHAVGCDLSFDYLSQQARPRLSLDALDAWREGAGLHVEAAPDLGPLFNHEELE